MCHYFPYRNLGFAPEDFISIREIEAHSPKPQTKQTVHLWYHFWMLCAVQQPRVLHVYLLVIIHEMKIKDLFLLRQKEVNQNRRYLLSYFPLYEVHSNATVKHDFINV